MLGPNRSPNTVPQLSLFVFQFSLFFHSFLFLYYSVFLFCSSIILLCSSDSSLCPSSFTFCSSIVPLYSSVVSLCSILPQLSSVFHLCSSVVYLSLVSLIDLYKMGPPLPRNNGLIKSSHRCSCTPWWDHLGWNQLAEEHSKLGLQTPILGDATLTGIKFSFCGIIRCIWQHSCRNTPSLIHRSCHHLPGTLPHHQGLDLFSPVFSTHLLLLRLLFVIP